MLLFLNYLNIFYIDKIKANEKRINDKLTIIKDEKETLEEIELEIAAENEVARLLKEKEDKKKRRRSKK
jgi:hypothetical protein